MSRVYLAECAPVTSAERLLRKIAEFLGVSLTATTVVRIRVGLVTKQATGAPALNQPGGKTMQLHDDEQVSYDIDAQDAKGVDIPGENFNADTSDQGVVTISQREDGTFLAVAGMPGSAVLTFSVPDSAINVTEAIDVVAGDVATISVTPGTPEKQPLA